MRIDRPGIRVVFMTGNHDMWVRDYFEAECGVEVYTSPRIMELAGKRVFLAHGDNMKIDHLPVLRFMNAVFRSKTIRFLFHGSCIPTGRCVSGSGGAASPAKAIW